MVFHCPECGEELFCISSHETGAYYGCVYCHKTYHEPELIKLREKVKSVIINFDDFKHSSKWNPSKNC